MPVPLRRLTRVVVITHEPEVAEYATRQIHFRDGKVAQDIKNEHIKQPERV